MPSQTGPDPPGAPLPAPGDPAVTLALLITRSPVGMAVIDRTGLLRTVNPAFCRLCGLAEAELLGQSFTRLLPAPRRARMLARLQAFLDGQSSIDGEWLALRPNGDTIRLRAQLVRVPGADAQPCGLLYVQDITQRKQADQALRASQRFLQAVLDGLPAHVCVLDEDGVILAVNQAWRQFALRNGGDAQQVNEGNNYLQVCQRALDHADADGRDQAEPFVRQLREVLAGHLSHFQLEYDCHAPHEQRWFLASVSRLLGSHPPRVVVLHDDVSAVKRAQDAVRASEAWLKDLTASIPGAMFRLARRVPGAWRFVYFSPGVLSLFELTAEQACADRRRVFAGIVAEDRLAFLRSMHQALVRGLPWEHAFRFRTASGRLKWVQGRSAPKPGQGGEACWTGVFTDVSARKRMEEGLRASEQKYRTLFETVPQGVVYQDASGAITSANPAAQRILGLTLDQLQGRASIDPRWRAHHEDGSDFPGDQHPAMQALRSGLPVRNVVMGVSAPGRGEVWLMVSATPLLRHGQALEVHTSFEEITERVLMSRELQLQANTDYLTGVANRRGLMARLQLEFSRLQQLAGHRCAVLAADLDWFKQINDRWGHDAGDAVLQHVAQLMQQTTRPRDLVARSGGEEFSLLLPEMDLHEATALAERLRLSLEARPTLWQGQLLPITVSVGVSQMGVGDAQADAVLVRADQALYRAKSSGRNQVCVAAPAG